MCFQFYEGKGYWQYSITIKELVTASGYSDGYIRKILASLKEKKIIERQGGNKTGKWVIKCKNN
jgi:predicted HTH transcriptional regulator